jgi:SDR family mycofactocin-dependent oxidoreductase
MGRVNGKVAFITGAGRGQGREHAVRLANEGADIIASDICADIDTVGYHLASKEDLDETARLVNEAGGRIVTAVADVRDYGALDAAVQLGLAKFGHIDIVCANAGILALALEEKDPAKAFQDVVDVNLTGVWNTVRVCLPSMVAAGRGGSIILTSSTAGLKGVGVDQQGSMEGYTAAKHGVVGLMRVFAMQYGKYSIRVNSVHPSGANTPMTHNEHCDAAFAKHGAEVGAAIAHVLPVERIDASDVTNAVLYLASDESRYVTGAALPVDAGATAR